MKGIHSDGKKEKWLFDTKEFFRLLHIVDGSHEWNRHPRTELKKFIQSSIKSAIAEQDKKITEAKSILADGGMLIKRPMVAIEKALRALEGIR